MLYDYLRSQYQPNEPIFLSDVSLPGVSRDNLRQQFKTLCDAGKIVRYEDGVYYIPARTRLKGGASLSPDLVALRKYISRAGVTDGYYSGFTFANQVGASLQVPQVREIVTNRTNSWRRAVRIRNQEFVLRKPRVPVTAENAKALQLLDLFKDLDSYSDLPVTQTAPAIRRYMKNAGLTLSQLEKYLPFFPAKTLRMMYEAGLFKGDDN